MMSDRILNQNSWRVLSKTISHALRHQPWLYELELDEEGWVSLESLLSSLRKEKAEWSDLTQADLAKMIALSDKKRHEIHNGKIRAIYGHSLPGKLVKTLAEPPVLLYHGTTVEAVKIIRVEGLKPMKRQYVHLSVDTETAKKVGRRKTKQPVILTVQSSDAYREGLRFYRGNDCVWLADFVLPKFIEF